jgi:tripartite-type tricarboxylate transporter receptor subunit TctC
MRLGGVDMRRIGLSLLSAFCLAVIGASAHAEPYPTKPIRILVPYAPGGLTDVVARLFAEQVRKVLNGAVFVENKPGASGILAIEEMARARPDGHTLMIGNISTNGLTPVLLAKKMRINYDKEVQIVARLVDVPVFFLATTANFPPKTFAEFLSHAKANPGKVRFGSAGMGSYQQINTAILAKRAGLDMVHIPFKDGGAPILRDLANGDIHVSWFNITNPVGMMREGKVRPLAVAADQRLAQYPDIPTIQELGYPDVRPVQWSAVYAPAGTPADIVETLHNAFVKAAATPELQEAFHKGGMLAPRQASLADVQAWIAKEMADWKKVVEELQISIDE